MAIIPLPAKAGRFLLRLKVSIILWGLSVPLLLTTYINWLLSRVVLFTQVMPEAVFFLFSLDGSVRGLYA